MCEFLEDLTFLNYRIRAIQWIADSVTVTFADFGHMTFQIQFTGVVFLECHALRQIEDGTVCRDSRQIENARDFLTRGGACSDEEAQYPFAQLTLLDDRNLPMFHIVFRDCRLIPGG